MVRFVAGAAPEVSLAEIEAVPPLLSLICEQLNARRLAEGTESVDAGQLRGRATDILEQFYGESFAGRPAGLRAYVEDELLSADGFRESRGQDSTRAALVRAGVAPEAAREAFEALVGRRLLVVEERGGTRRVELTHDVLTAVAARSRGQRREREALARAKAKKAAAACSVGCSPPCPS